MSKIISIANRKGGVSKTSTGLFLATALARNKDYKIMYLDCDSQASAYQYRQFEKQNIYGSDTTPPYPIRRTNPTYIFDEIQDYKERYDFIFIDIPRLTHGEGDSRIASILTLCNIVLVPIKSGELDNLSTLGFIKMLQEIAAYKAEKNHEYQYAAFLSMTGRRKTDDADARAFIESLNVPLFENELKDVRALSRPYTYESLLDKTKEERKRFEPFFNEFTKTFNL